MNYREIQQPVSDLLAASDEILKKEIGGRIELIQKLQSRTPILKGKKIRSTFLFLLAGLNDVAFADLPAIAASFEMFHLSSLIHDDIMDNSQWRRGEKTVNSHFGSTLSVLWGDYLYINSLNLVNKVPCQGLMSILVDTSRQMVEGQIMDFGNNFNYDINLDTYFSTIRSKTAVLFVAAARIVALLKGTSPATDPALENFGDRFGMIFQISDDLLDIFSGNTGKDQFRDVQEGKITLPYILLLKKEPEKTRLCLTENRTSELLELLSIHHIQTESRAVIEKYLHDCRDYLASFPTSPFRDSLHQLIDFICHRDF